MVESALELSFLKLGVRDSALDQPVVMTEPLGGIPSQRACMSEMLFEAYGASHVSYGIDSLFSYFYHDPSLQDGLIIDLANCCTGLIAYESGHVDF